MNELLEPFERLLAGVCTPAAVRTIEAGGSATGLWDAIESSGFIDALVPQEHGGYGLSLADVFGLWVATGRHVTPVPVGHTMLARAALAQAGGPATRGPIAIASLGQDRGGHVISRQATFGLVADWFVVPLPDRWLLLPRQGARCTSSGIRGSLHADLEWTSDTVAAFEARSPVAWQNAGAAVAAAQIAGALERTLEITLEFANQRVQFGRSLGKFQAIQHQLAVMAENVSAARMSAEIGCASESIWPQPLRAAAAKARASEAAALVAPMAHAIHGAIGITAELDLQLFTRRLHEWRADFGSERAWNTVIGRAAIEGGQAPVDFMRAQLLTS